MKKVYKIKKHQKHMRWISDGHLALGYIYFVLTIIGLTRGFLLLSLISAIAMILANHVSKVFAKYSKDEFLQ